MKLTLTRYKYIGKPDYRTPSILRKGQFAYEFLHISRQDCCCDGMRNFLLPRDEYDPIDVTNDRVFRSLIWTAGDEGRTKVVAYEGIPHLLFADVSYDNSASMFYILGQSWHFCSNCGAPILIAYQEKTTRTRNPPE